PSWPSNCSGSGCTRCWSATTPPWRRCANGTSVPSRGRWCCCRARPVPAARPTGIPLPTSCAWTGRRRRGCAPCLRVTKCWTAGALKGDAERAAAHTQREAADATTQVERLSGRLAEVETRLATLRAELERHEVERVRLDERLGAERARLVELEAQQEAAREQRVHWQVEAAQVEAHLAAARARAERAAADAAEARRQGASLADEMATIDREL